ncbi:MAG: DUF4160 domain-containing protein [Schwartzia sp.]|nr:DUF4160 domain-containing protein [Schwartzia sp. (in: firmicutes)]
MPKYYAFKVCGYYLYFTSHCIVEAMHVHASDRKLTEAASAKFFVMGNGDTRLENRGVLNDMEIRAIRAFIKENYLDMYRKWASMSDKGFYGE